MTTNAFGVDHGDEIAKSATGKTIRELNESQRDAKQFREDREKKGPLGYTSKEGKKAYAQDYRRESAFFSPRGVNRKENWETYLRHTGLATAAGTAAGAVGGAAYGAARGGKTGAIIGTGAGAGVGANVGSYVGGATGTTVVANRAQKKALKRAEAKGHIRRAKKNEKVGFFSGQIKPRKGKVSKAGDWKTIDQRETAQRRNRKHAAQVGAAGSLASLAGGTYLAASPEAQRSVARGIDRAQSTYKLERMFNRSSKHLPRAAGKAVKASLSGKGSGRARVVTGLIGGGLATQAAAYGAAGARNSYHQKKINERRRANHARKKEIMAKSAFGVEHGDSISKAAPAKQKKASTGRLALGTVLPGYHGLAAGKKGHKLRAAGNEIGGRIVGSAAGGIAAAPLTTAGMAHATKPAGIAALAGGAAISAGSSIYGGVKGTQRAQRMGHYKPER